VRQRALLRRWAAWGAQEAPLWFVRLAPLLIGGACALVLRGPRAAVLRNIRRIEGEQSLARELLLVLRTFVEFARALTASLAPDRAIFRDRTYRTRGREWVEPMIEAGQGFLILTAHVGPWDTAAMGLRHMMSVPVMMLMSPEADERTGELHDALRDAADVSVLRVGETALGLLPVLAHLKEGGVVVAQMDRVPEAREALEVALFDEVFPVPLGLFKLAAVTGAPVVPVFAARLDSKRDLIQVAPPLLLPRRATLEQMKAAAQEVTRHLEAHLSAFPTQWFHFD
jgi:lauroyl/myristoyl acyltransferase